MRSAQHCPLGQAVTLLIAQGIFQQKSTKIRHRPALLLGAAQQRFMHVVAEGD